MTSPIPTLDPVSLTAGPIPSAPGTNPPMPKPAPPINNPRPPASNTESPSDGWTVPADNPAAPAHTLATPTRPTQSPPQAAINPTLADPGPPSPHRDIAMPSQTSVTPISPNPASLTHDIADSAPPGAAQARPIHDVELPAFDPATTGADPAQSGLVLEKVDPAQRSVWTSENPALRAPCCRQSESGYVPHRPGKDQFHPADPPPSAANPESGPWSEPIGHAETLLVP
jgi:hypothetical protein